MFDAYCAVFSESDLSYQALSNNENLNAAVSLQLV